MQRKMIAGWLKWCYVIKNNGN